MARTKNHLRLQPPLLSTHTITKHFPHLQGPRLGHTLRALKRQQWNEELTTASQALAYLRQQAPTSEGGG